MAGILDRLFGRKPATAERSVPATTTGRKRSTRREPPAELDWTRATYIPLPPSPPRWEVDGSSDHESDLADPILGPVFDAAQIFDHVTVVALAAGLAPQHRRGRVAGVIAKSYRKVILSKEKADELHTAANKSLEMFEVVPDEVQAADKRRFNRIVGKLEKEGKQHSYVKLPIPRAEAVSQFTVSEGAGWLLKDERKLEPDEQPDPKFHAVAVDSEGTWLLHRVKATTASPDATCALRRIDRTGRAIAERRCSHDAYRVGIGSAGPNLAILDSNGALHVYDPNLNLIVDTDLRRDTRVVDHFATIETDYWGEFKTQIRAVDVSPDGDRYLFTLADEAWCLKRDGTTVWGVSMPLRDGWARVVGRSDRYGVSAEIDHALGMFDLALPVAPKDIKARWRALALEHHPDRNPNDPQATRKMTEINQAFEILTGVDPETLSYTTEDTDKTHFVQAVPLNVIRAGGLTVEMYGGVPQDWVYAASFAASDGGAYVATYSGKVILLSREGHPTVVYDIGVCPTAIVDQGTYTYFLTPTRLYVVEERSRLTAFLDVFEQGRLLVTATGFGLLESKQLQWFTPDGAKVGEVESRDPIRVLAATGEGAVIQTRRHEVIVHGLVG